MERQHHPHVGRGNGQGAAPAQGAQRYCHVPGLRPRWPAHRLGQPRPHRPRLGTAGAMNTANRVFILCLALLGGTYVVLIVAMLAADLLFTTPGDFIEALASPEIRYAIRLSLISCTISTLMAMWVAVPLGYLLARTTFPGKAAVDTLLDVPIVLPPLVIGLSLLILFQTDFGKLVQQLLTVTYAVPSVILAQFSV